MTTKTIPVLESGVTPVEGQVYRLYEDFTDFSLVSDPYVVERTISPKNGEMVLTERKTGGVNELMIIRGVFQRADVQNANKRVYPRAIWEKWTSTESDLMRRVVERECTGQIEHPKDGAGNLKEAAIVVTKLSLEKDGTVIGEAEVLDTPCGEVVRGLMRSRVKVGISSRGTGTVDSRGNVDEKTYKPETWDIVGNPSTPGAYPKIVERAAIAESIDKSRLLCRAVQTGTKVMWTVMDESTGVTVRTFEATVVNQNHGDHTMNAKNKYETLRTRVEAHVASDITESAVVDLSNLDRALVDSSIEGQQIVAEDATLVPAIAAVQESIAAKRKAIAEEQANRKKKPVESHDDGDDCDDDDVTEDADGDDSPQSLDEALEVLASVRPVLIEQAEKIEAQDELIEQMATDLAEGEATIADLTESLAAANAVIAEMTGTKQGETVAEAVEAAIKSTPSLEESRSFLERCTSTDEVKTLVERLSVSSGAGKPPAKRTFAGNGLPAVGGDPSSSLDEQAGKSRTGATRADGDKPLSRSASLVKSMLERSTGKAKPQVNG